VSAARLLCSLLAGTLALTAIVRFGVVKYSRSHAVFEHWK